MRRMRKRLSRFKSARIFKKSFRKGARRRAIQGRRVSFRGGYRL